MQVLIIEDEPLAANRLKKIITEIKPSIKVIDILDSVESALHWFNTHPENQLDVIFMDIQLSDGISFEILQNTDIKCPIIFTTAYDEYALRAFKHNSIDYLLKPIAKEEVATALNKYDDWFNHKSNTNNNGLIDVQKLLSSLNLPSSTTNYKTRFLAKIGDKFIPLNTQEIKYFYSEEKALFAIKEDKSRYLLEYTLDELETLLNPKEYFRLNRQCIAHINAITKLQSGINGKVKVTLHPLHNEEVTVSRERASVFKKWMEG